MTIEFELNGARRQVRVRREGDRWIASLDGRELALTMTPAAGRWSMLVSSLGGPAKAGHHEEGPPEGGHYEQDVVSGFSRTRTTSYDIAFDQGSGSALTVFVNGIAVPLTVVDPRSRWRRGGRDRSDDARPVAVTAPMPGRIVKVLVQPGETVTARQGVVVVEAMKMENELRAPRGGRVAEERVAEGASVEANTVLVVLE